MKNSTKFIYIALLLASVSTFGFAQEPESKNILDLSLEELMALPVSVASQKALTQRESPGILSIVTKEEIENSGARDLIDVLRLVPGIDFGLDVDQVGISMRGAWGFEGKVLLMIDGQELNELLYGTTQFGNHYPVDNIKRIEVIRGPGSAIYGGRAELGVINIITETGQDINGVKVTANYGQTKESKRGNVNIGIGKKINDFEFSVNGFMGNGNRSDRIYYNHDMTDSTSLQPTSVNGKIKYKGVEANVIYDQYNTKTNIYGGIYSIDYGSLLGNLKYRFLATNKLSITPSVSYSRSTPWATSYVNAKGVEEPSVFKVSITKIKPGIEANYDVTEKINLTAGVEYYTETGKYHNDTILFWNQKNNATISNTTVYAQALIKNNIVNVTLGGRVEKNSEFGTAFAPRIGLTKCFDKLHFKLLFSQAFRSPALGNIDSYEWSNPNSDSNIEPEKTRVFEFETGYKLSKDMAITANVYYIKMDKPIVYAGTYENKDQTGTKGFELEYRIRKNWGYVNANYAFYSAAGINKVTEYTVPNAKGSLLGTPQHKVTLNSSFNLTKRITLNPTLTYLGERYGADNWVFNEESNKWELPIVKVTPTVLANIFLNYKDLLIKNLNIGIGCYNLLDKEHKFIQAYNAGSLPMPSQTREFIIKLSYKI